MEQLFDTQEIVYTTQKRRRTIKKPEDIARLDAVKFIRHQPQENLIAIALNNASEVVSIELIAKGKSNLCFVDIADIVRGAIIRSCNRLIVVHNHPSGKMTPSKSDIEMANRLSDMCEKLGIEFLDSVIVGKTTVSLKRENLI